MVFSLLVVPLLVFPHGINMEKLSGVLGVRVSGETGAPLKGEDVFVFSSKETSVPSHEGKTDGHGEFFFSPDHPGLWRVVVEDGAGHRTELFLNGGDFTSSPRSDRPARVLAGLGFLFGLFGLWALFRRRVG